MSRYLAPRRVTPEAPATIPAARMLRRRTLPPPPLSTASCWTEGRLENAGVMVGLMMSNVSDAVLSDICKTVEAERLRSAAA
jgi:hypothetical protein